MASKKGDAPAATPLAQHAPLEVRHVHPDTLNPAPYNPRKMSAKQVAELRESLVRFGLQEPLIVNKNAERANVVIGGHQRLRLARELGYATVPVVFVDLNEAQERELNLRLNQNLGEWDWDALANMGDAAFLTAVGFSTAELQRHFDLDNANAAANVSSQVGGMTYQVLVTCSGEQQQRELLQRFDGEGLPCRALIL